MNRFSVEPFFFRQNLGAVFEALIPKLSELLPRKFNTNKGLILQTAAVQIL